MRRTFIELILRYKDIHDNVEDYVINHNSRINADIEPMYRFLTNLTGFGYDGCTLCQKAVELAEKAVNERIKCNYCYWNITNYIQMYSPCLGKSSYNALDRFNKRAISPTDVEPLKKALLERIKDMMEVVMVAEERDDLKDMPVEKQMEELKKIW